MEEKTVVHQRPLKSPGFAGVLGMFPFGVGALYNGQYTKALLHLIIFAGLVHMQGRGGGQPFIGLLLAGFIVYQFFDNIQSAKAINAAAAGQAVTGVQELPEITSSGSIFWGIVLIVLGAVLILANFEVIRYETLFDFWPVAVIVVGLKLVVDSVVRSKNGK
jgi:ABC-type polysaccharide/polyol phosphate export permease